MACVLWLNVVYRLFQVAARQTRKYLPKCYRAKAAKRARADAAGDVGATGGDAAVREDAGRAVPGRAGPPMGLECTEREPPTRSSVLGESVAYSDDFDL